MSRDKITQSKQWPKDYIFPSWLPDWRYEDEYPVLAATSKRQYAWEFLRRNPEYQADYLKCVKLCEQEGANHRYLKALGLNITPPLDDTPIPSMKFHISLYRTLSKWGLAHYLLDPSFECHDTADLDFISRLGRFNIAVESTQIITDLIAANDHVIEQIPLDGGILPSDSEIPWLFDINLPIEPQIIAANNLLDEIQKSAFGKKQIAAKSEINKFNSYLRLLDADAIGASNKEIMEEFWPGKNEISYVNKNKVPYKSESHNYPSRDLIRHSRKAAYHLRDIGYKLLF